MTQTPEKLSSEEILRRFAQQSGIDQNILDDLMAHYTDAQKAEMAANYASDKRKEGKREEIEFTLTPIEEGTIIHLSDVIYLNQTPIEDASEAMRALNDDTVENYQATYLDTPDVMPAVKLTGTSWGYLCLDGRHRLQAQENNLKSRFIGKDEKFVNGGRDAWKKAREEQEVKYEVVVCDDFTSALVYAFRANMANGLSMGKNNRVRYALWLQRQAEKLGTSLNDRDAAKEAGLLGHTGIVNMRTRLAVKIAQDIVAKGEKGVERKDVKMPADYTLMPADFDKRVNAEIKKIKAEPENKLEKPLEALFKNIVILAELLNDAEALAPEMVEFFINSENTVQAAEIITEAIAIAIDEATQELDEQAADMNAKAASMVELSQVND